MKPTDEEIWQRSGLFAELDALDRGTPSLNPTLPDGTYPLPLSSNYIPRFPPPHSISLPCKTSPLVLPLEFLRPELMVQMV
jgi:hypothetical protein